jgi:hypothetical protein
MNMYVQQQQKLYHAKHRRFTIYSNSGLNHGNIQYYHLKPTNSSNPIHRTHHPPRPTKTSRILPQRALRLLALPVPPNTILLARHTIEMRVLVPTYALFPCTAYSRGVDEDVGLLGVVPGLGVLVSVALDADVGVCDEEFD